ncbi:hypothetical protein E1379_13470 [Salmonella enterica subsp. enterica serovar Brunei]|nr:hypothetical protein [Salmonella enterica subsp. enterica serovar Brunei]
MWLMKTLLTSGCTNQRGAGHRHYSGDCQPKENSPILYNRHEVDNWVERQQPARPRAKK